MWIKPFSFVMALKRAVSTVLPLEHPYCLPLRWCCLSDQNRFLLSVVNNPLPVQPRLSQRCFSRHAAGFRCSSKVSRKSRRSSRIRFISSTTSILVVQWNFKARSKSRFRIRVLKCRLFKMQMVINLAPASLSNKKVNFYTCPRLTFLKKNATENAYKSISEPLNFKIFWGGACPHTPLAAHAFGARNLPRLVLKSGYGPGLSTNVGQFRVLQVSL